jgi:hypothetical protein
MSIISKYDTKDILIVNNKLIWKRLWLW